MAKKYLKEFYWKDYFTITIGLILYALGLVGFIKPVGIVTGGLAGVGLLVEYATGGTVPLQETFFMVNVVLVLIALKILGVKFMTKTIYGVLVLSFLLTTFAHLIKEPIILDEPLMSGIIGGMLCGAGLGMVFTASGSTGGTDIIIAILNKYRSMTFGRGMLLCDFIIISSSYLIFGSVSKIVYGLLVLGVMTYTVDMVINGSRQSVQVLIMSEKYATIADAINKEIRRGCTLLDGMGWYTQKPSKVILVLTRRSESLEIYRLVKSIDEDAFITESLVRGVYGKGFEQIKK